MPKATITPPGYPTPTANILNPICSILNLRSQENTPQPTPYEPETQHAILALSFCGVGALEPEGVRDAFGEFGLQIPGLALFLRCLWT